MARPKKAQTVPEEAKAKLAAAQDLPTQTEFVRELFRLAGGPKALAVMVWTEFRRGDASPMLRTRILELLLRALGTIEAKVDPQKYVAELSDDELQAFLNERIEREVQKRMEGEQGDGTAGPDPGAAPQAAVR